MALFLSGVCICATGISSKEEKHIKCILKELGGKYSDNFTGLVTHLLVKRVGSPKHEMALKQNILAVELQWLLDCRSCGRRVEEDSYRVRPFTGLTVCVTQFEVDERHAIMRLIESNGGVFSSHMEQDICTHLICLRPEGAKFEAARTWRGVRVVTRQWADDCVTRGRWLSEADYPVLDATFKVPHPPTRTTTRHKDIVKRRRDALASSLGPSRAPAVPVQSKEEDDDMPLRLLTRVLSATRDVLSLPEKDEFGDKVDFLAVYRFVEEKSGNAAAPVFRKEALAGDIFFIYGFSPEATVLIMQLLFIGGGIRHHMITDKVTKVILGPHTRERMKYSVKMHPCSVVPLKLTWLVKTVLLQLDPSLLTDNSTPTESVSTVPAEEGQRIVSIDEAETEEAEADVVADTQDVMALLLPSRASGDRETMKAPGKLSGGIGDRRVVRGLGGHRRFRSSSPDSSNHSAHLPVQGTETSGLDPVETSEGSVSVSSVLNKRRRMQRAAASVQRRTEAAAAAPPQESEVVVYEADSLGQYNDW